MTIISLPARNGFSQRFFGNTITPYLKHHFKEFATHDRARVNLERVRKDVLAYKHIENNIIPDYNMKLAIAKAREAFRLPQKVQMLHLNDVFRQDLNIWSSSPGLPWNQCGFKTKGEIRDDLDAVNRVRWFWHRVKLGDHMPKTDCCAFVRSHISERGENKVRAVWGYPATMTFGELVFAKPLIDAYQEYKRPIAYGYDLFCGGTKRISDQIRLHPYKIAMDFKSFDKTVPNFLIDVAFDILMDNIDFINYQDYGVADARKTIRMYEYIRDYFKRTPVRLADGSRYLKIGGVPSGSTFTQIIDSVCSYILSEWVTLSQTGSFADFIKVFGDDGIIGHRVPIDLIAAEDLVSSIGMHINVKKSVCSDDYGKCTFLGYGIRDGLPYKPRNMWVTSLIYPERPDDSWDMCATRALGLLYANMGCDDWFDSVCRAIIAYKKFDIIMSRNLERFIRQQGVVLSAKPPSRLELMAKLL